MKSGITNACSHTHSRKQDVWNPVVKEGNAKGGRDSMRVYVMCIYMYAMNGRRSFVWSYVADIQAISSSIAVALSKLKSHKLYVSHRKVRVKTPVLYCAKKEKLIPMLVLFPLFSMCSCIGKMLASLNSRRLSLWGLVFYEAVSTCEDIHINWSFLSAKSVNFARFLLLLQTLNLHFLKLVRQVLCIEHFFSDKSTVNSGLCIEMYIKQYRQKTSTSNFFWFRDGFFLYLVFDEDIEVKEKNADSNLFLCIDK